jgi:hypothetical protein
MVAVSILLVMILSFSVLLSQTQKLVTTAQRSIQMNTSAAAIAQMIRDDVASLSKDGFLYVKHTVNNPRDTLMFTTTGSYQSVLDESVAPAARVDYGLTLGNALWRRCTLLDPNRPPGGDHEQRSLADYADATVISAATGGISEPPFVLPPGPGDVENLRSYLAGACTQFRVYYTLPAINWNSPWVPVSDGVAAIATWKKGDTTWPAILRVRFTLTEYDEPFTYEVICPLPVGP